MKKTLYHGSTDIIETPEFGKGNPRNDYGTGFYCTENKGLAKEWACASEVDGFANEYELDMEGLSVCDLSTGHHILNWMAVLLENRTFALSSGTAAGARDYIIKTFMPEYKDFDIIKGYRADDSYFSFAKDFLNNTISLQTLSEAMRLGKLGQQIVLKSEKAFSMIRFIRAEYADSSEFHPLRMSRDRSARENYQTMKSSLDITDATFVMDIMRGGWKNDDERLR